MTDHQLEPMADFFARRVDGYDEHMLETVAGCREGYAELAARMPGKVETLLDLGVGTGLELAEIFRRFPEARVTGVDLCQEMLAECSRKYPGKRMTLICGDYTRLKLGTEAFDAVVSFETLHHLTAAAKRTLYRGICETLKKGGLYLQGDYNAIEDAEETEFRRQFGLLCKEEEVEKGAPVHFDTPLTAAHDCTLLRQAGFVAANVVWQKDHTALIVARKTDEKP